MSAKKLGLILGLTLSLFLDLSAPAAQAPPRLALTLRGTFTCSFKSLDPCGACAPADVKGTLELSVDFSAGRIRGTIQADSSGEVTITHCSTNQPATLSGLMSFRGSPEGRLDPLTGAFDVEFFLDGQSQTRWISGCENCPDAGGAFRRKTRMSGQVSRFGLGSGQLFSPEGSCPMTGTWTARGEVTPLRVDEIESIPKDRGHYYYEAAIPEPEQFGDSTLDPFDEMYERRRGEMEIIFIYRNRSGVSSSILFRKPMAELIPETDEALEQVLSRGEMYIPDKASRRLVLGYKILDELERITRKAENSPIALSAGERIFRGSRIDFSWLINLYDRGRHVAGSTAPSVLRYTLRYPVVFVPGTGGSRLAARTGDAFEELWPANAWRGTRGASDREYWKRLGMGLQEEPVLVEATDVFRYYGQSWGPLVVGLTGALGKPIQPKTQDIYRGFLDHLRTQGYGEFNRPRFRSTDRAETKHRLFVFPYDWRMDIGEHALELDKLVDQALDLHFNRLVESFGAPRRPAYKSQEGDRIVLIGHGQGGLVIRSFVNTAERAAKVESIIMLGTPNLGSPIMFRGLAGTGYNFGAIFLHPEVGKWLARDWTGPYQMLPATEAGEFAGFLFNERGKALSNVLVELRKIRTHLFCFLRTSILSGGGCEMSWGLNDLHLDRAREFLQKLPNPAAQGIRTFVVAGFDQPTVVGFNRLLRRLQVDRPEFKATERSTIEHEALQGRLHPEYVAQTEYPIVAETATHYTVSVPYFEEVISACGDGVVPLHSGLGLKGATLIPLPGLRHFTMTEEASVQNIVDRLLQGVFPGVLAVPDRSSLPSAITNGISITATSSPAFLHVYDESGRHTGVGRDGVLDEDIPGSIYDLQGESQRVWLPPLQGPLRVVLEGTVDAQLDLILRAGDGAQEKRVEYLGIQEKPGSRAELPFTMATLGQDTPLGVDANGDGVVDETRSPGEVAQAVVQEPSPEIQEEVKEPEPEKPPKPSGPSFLSRLPIKWILIGLAGLAVAAGIAALAVYLIKQRRSFQRAKIIATLSITYKNGRWETFKVGKGTTSIGRDPSCTLVLSDAEVSWHHAEITVTPQGFLLRDTSSSNGTFVNGSRITKKYLYLGDEITLGSTRISLEI